MKSPQQFERELNNEIHPTAFIHDDAKIGKGNQIGPFCIIGPNVIIGDRNRLEGHVSCGTPAEHKDFFHKSGPVKIGDDNIIREFVTINGGTKYTTIMGNHCIMLRGSHLSHDSVLEDFVTVSCDVMIGGESYIMEGANLGMGSVIHQRQVIGSYAMVGMGSVITKNFHVEPGMVCVGNPATPLRMNHVGLERSQITQDHLDQEDNRFRDLKRTK